MAECPAAVDFRPAPAAPAAAVVEPAVVELAVVELAVVAVGRAAEEVECSQCRADTQACGHPYIRPQEIFRAAVTRCRGPAQHSPADRHQIWECLPVECHPEQAGQDPEVACQPSLLASQTLVFPEAASPVVDNPVVPAVPVDNPAVPVANPVANPVVPVDNPAVPVSSRAVPVANRAVPASNPAVPVDPDSSRVVPVSSRADPDNPEDQGNPVDPVSPNSPVDPDCQMAACLRISSHPERNLPEMRLLINPVIQTGHQGLSLSHPRRLDRTRLLQSGRTGCTTRVVRNLRNVSLGVLGKTTRNKEEKRKSITMT